MDNEDLVSPAELKNYFMIVSDGGRIMLSIDSQGIVSGEIEDASEAGKMFVESIRFHGKDAFERIAYLEKGLREIAKSNMPEGAMAQGYLDGIHP